MFGNIGSAYLSRREWLKRTSTGFGAAALAALLNEESHAGNERTHFAPKAKSVIFCYMSGGVSQVDSFDPKPVLEQEAGKPLPAAIERTQFNNNGNLMPSPWKFNRYGESQLPVSDLFPHIGRMADELCVIRSMTAKFSEHAQGNFFMHTGLPFLGYPSAGAWIDYALGGETKNLPGFALLRSGGSSVPHGGPSLFGSGFLPAVHQASFIDADSPEPVRNVRPRESDAIQRRRLEFASDFDRRFAAELAHDPAVEAAIRNAEIAYRMQRSIPEAVDLSQETAETKELYGVDSQDAHISAYAKQCLLARRLVERGVRFVELTCLSHNLGGGNGPNPWDHHGKLREGHEKMARQVDRPIAALLADLKRTGLLDTTLVVWAGEFGRTPFSQGSDGRDHDPYGFSIWLAGGGVKGGTTYGATDDFGYKAVDKPCDVFDLWATVLHQLGFDHERLTYRFGGRDIRLTDVHGRVIREVLG